MKPTEIQHFQDRLLEMREQVREGIQTSRDALPDEVRPVGEHDWEPSGGLDSELAVEHNEEQAYHAINAALKRIEQGTYGRCIECQAHIPKARLNAIPYTAYCIECERKQEL